MCWSSGFVDSERRFTLGVCSGKGRYHTLIWIDPVKWPLRLSKSPPSMCSIQGAARMISDGGPL